MLLSDILPMIPASLVAIVPTIWGYFAGQAVLRYFSSRLTVLVAAWFFGQFVTTWLCYCFAMPLRSFTGTPLVFSLALSLVLLAAHSVWLWRRNRPDPVIRTEGWSDAACVAGALTVSTAMYLRHLRMSGDAIERSELFWDFNGVFSLVQGFVHGGNFPPTCDVVAGAPLAYHFFFFFHMATYSAAGLDLVAAFNIVSIVGFAAMLLLVVGLTTELSGSRLAGIVAATCTLTTASLHFVDYFVRPQGGSLWERIVYPFVTTLRQHDVAFLRDHAIGYNGNMLNLFYFIEERQLAAGCLVLLLTVSLLRILNRLSYRTSIVLGMALGLAAQWHLFVLIGIGVTLTGMLVYRGDRLKTLSLLMPLAVLSAAQLIALKLQMTDQWYVPGYDNTIGFDLTFATLERDTPMTFSRWLRYWLFVLGAKLVTVPIGLLLLVRRGEGRAAKAFGVTMLCFFALTNSLTISPLGVYENHKWIRPVWLLTDCLSGIVVAHVLGAGVFRMVSGALVWAALTFSGLIESVGYFRAQPMRTVAVYPSPYVLYLRERTLPSSIIATTSPLDTLLAGRRTYVATRDAMGGNVRLDHNLLRLSPRLHRQKQIFSSPDLRSVCRLATGEGIDYIEIPAPIPPQSAWAVSLSTCTAGSFANFEGKPVVIVSVGCACNSVQGR